MAHTGTSDLGGDGPAELAGGELEGELPHEGQVRLGGGNTVEVLPGAQNGNEVQDGDHGASTAQVNGTATEARQKDEPTAKGTGESQGVAADVEVVDGGGGKADLLVEVGSIVRKGL